ncbi:MAG: dTMP kinase [Fimbriimonadales bacterium]|nr:dTMP kinase [Fimbriimonadales bacterium]
MFISFEGPEGAGKTTLIGALDERLRALGRATLVTREPGAAMGGQIRRLLLEGAGMDPKTELFLFLADRAEHAAKVLRPALAEGRVVLCDRHADSTVVYQGYGRGLDLDQLRRWNAFATAGLKPDLTVLLDLPPEIGLARLQSRDRLDREPLEFHRAVRRGFLEEARLEPDRWVVLDATLPKERVLECAWQPILDRLPRD